MIENISGILVVITVLISMFLPPVLIICHTPLSSDHSFRTPRRKWAGHIPSCCWPPRVIRVTCLTSPGGSKRLYFLSFGTQYLVERCWPPRVIHVIYLISPGGYHASNRLYFLSFGTQYPHSVLCSLYFLGMTLSRHRPVANITEFVRTPENLLLVISIVAATCVN